VDHEEAEWFKEQGNKSCKKMKRSEQRSMLDDDIDYYDCGRLWEDFMH
jgi:hypothetical protein